jgi:hypothetical protein
VTRRLGDEAADASARHRYALTLVAGLAGAAAAYSAFILAVRLTGASRTQFLSAPWIGIALASAAALLASMTPRRTRLPLLALLGAFVAASGAARTAQLQTTWDRTGTYPRQAGTMAQMAALAPQFKPGTLVIFIEGTRTWVGTFVFNHAIDVVYGRHVAGCVANGRETAFYTCRQDPQGFHHEPWTMLERAWNVAPHTYRFDEVAVVRSDADGRVSLVDVWPPDLPPLTPGAVYAPHTRIDPVTPAPASRAVLDRII